MDFSPVLLLTGSAGGGKSRVAAEKIHLYCMHYPGTTALVTRKLEKDVKRSAMKMLKRVIGKDPHVAFHAAQLEYEYDNGSVIYFAGMRDEDARERIRSIGDGKVDIVWMEEAHENEEEDFEEIAGRMRGDVAGWNQIILTTNPHSFLHWINRRLILNNEASVHTSRASSNPYNPKSYFDMLDRLTGVKRKRLKDGLWVEASGMVIDTWSDMLTGEMDNIDCNVTEQADYDPNGGDVFLFADDGYAGSYDAKAKMYTEKSHPRVFLLAQEMGDGSVNVFYESYQIKTRREDHLVDIKTDMDKYGYPMPSIAIYDSASPSLGNEIRIWGVRSVYPGTKNLDDSIDVLRDAIGADENDYRKIHVHPRCRILRLEMGAWTFDKYGKPGKYFDNGPDALRYGMYYINDPERAKLDIATSESADELVEDLFSNIDAVWKEYMGDLSI